MLSAVPAFRLLVIGDEILSGKRHDQHLSRVIGILAERGLQLGGCEYVADDPQAITAVLERAFASAALGEVVFSTGGIGATPDDHTRACAAMALGRPLLLHAQAAALIDERMRDMARQNNHAYEPNRPDNLHRLKMAEFPEGAQLIPNPYNKVAGFFIAMGDWGVLARRGGVYFVPGFPVMAWPMLQWVLDTHYTHLFHRGALAEQSLRVKGVMESTLTPLMEEVESRFAGVRTFSLPSMDHPRYGRHIELGVKAKERAQLQAAFACLRAGLAELGVVEIA